MNEYVCREGGDLRVKQEHEKIRMDQQKLSLVAPRRTQLVWRW